MAIALEDLNRPFFIKTDASAAVQLSAASAAEALQPFYFRRWMAYFGQSFISTTLTAAEHNYTVQKRERLAVVWAVEKYWSHIEFMSFNVHCDHASLTWMLNTKVVTNGFATAGAEVRNQAPSRLGKHPKQCLEQIPHWSLRTN